MKVIQINGISIDKRIKFKAKIRERGFIFEFMPYKSFLKENIALINSDVIGECETVVLYQSMGNNSIEVYYIKIFLSIFYFSYRIDAEERRKNMKKNMKSVL